MRGLNRVIISGYVCEKINYGNTREGGAQACSFTLASSRVGQGKSVTAYIKINVYGDGLVGLCRSRLFRSAYLLVEGELMNRDGAVEELTEVRARELIFLAADEETQTEGAENGG